MDNTTHLLVNLLKKFQICLVFWRGVVGGVVGACLYLAAESMAGDIGEALGVGVSFLPKPDRFDDSSTSASMF